MTWTHPPADRIGILSFARKVRAHLPAQLDQVVPPCLGNPVHREQRSRRAGAHQRRIPFAQSRISAFTVLTVLVGIRRDATAR